jgi:phosphonate ABC transporter substrate-binding protein
VSGRYFAERAPALDFVRQEKPEFGIFSLAAFLSLKSSLSLSVVGEVQAPKAGGTQYFLVGKGIGALEACTGHRVATTFAADAKFIDRVVARGAFKLADFTLVDAHRPLEPLKLVLRGEAECALIDDAQLEASRHIEQGDELKSVWHSAELPGMAVVAFPRADAAAVATFKKTLGGLCSDAREACATVGIERIRPAADERYRAALDAFVK